MWNYKSGRKPNPARRRPCVEECRSVSVVAYLAGERPEDLGPIEMVATRPHFGGERHWFACPRCGHRRGMLHHPGGAEGWACRLCHGLTLRACRESHRDETFAACLSWWVEAVPRLGWAGAADLAEIHHLSALVKAEAAPIAYPLPPMPAEPDRL